MAKTSLFAGQIATLLLACCDFAPPAHAGLSRPPSSHTEPTADGRHVLVFLVPVELIEKEYVTEEEYNCTVLLNNMYRASGCYEIGSTTPLWTAPWDSRDRWVVSDDCRYLVRWNVFGDGKFGAGGDMSWGLKFYDRGKEIKCYNASELVDFPSLMPFTSGDWHFAWIGDYDDNLIIRNGMFVSRTSTHEQYVFNVSTGKIVEQFRLWRMLTRVGAAFVVLFAFGVAVRITRKRRTASTNPPTAICSPQTPQPIAIRQSRRLFSFSLRTLLLLIALVAVLCLAVPRWPHVILLFAAVLIAVYAKHSAIRYRSVGQVARIRGQRRAGFGIRVAVAILAWCCCYFLSVAPVLRFVEWVHAPDDVRMAIILTVYRPLVWISSCTSTNIFWPLEWYSRAWGID